MENFIIKISSYCNDTCKYTIASTQIIVDFTNDFFPINTSQGVFDNCPYLDIKVYDTTNNLLGGDFIEFMALDNYQYSNPHHKDKKQIINREYSYFYDFNDDIVLELNLTNFILEWIEPDKASKIIIDYNVVERDYSQLN